MTQEQIDALIAVRNSITDICTEFTTNTAAIDAVLAEIPAGVDNRVDLLLGRPEAVLPPRPEYNTQHAPLLHQCGWCGEWYTGARVDHGCPPPPVSAMEQDYIESFDTPRESYILNPVVTLEQPETIALVEMTRIIFEQAAPIEY